MYGLIKEHLVVGLDRNDRRLPKVICASCRRILYFYAKEDFTRTISLFDYSKLNTLRPITHSNPDCSCHVCATGRGHLIDELGQFRKLDNFENTNSQGKKQN